MKLPSKAKSFIRGNLFSQRRRRSRRRGVWQQLEDRRLLAADYVLDQTLLPDELGFQANAQFGYAIDRSDQLRVAGARLASVNRTSQVGQVSIYDTTDSLVATLTDPSGAASSQFGTAVATDGQWVAISALSDVEASNSGVVHVYDFSGGQPSWVRTIPANVPSNNDGFGRSLSLDGGLLAISAPGESSADGSLAGAGAVYLLDLNSDPNGEPAVIRSSSPRADAGFGQEVELDTGRLFVYTVATSDPVFNEDGDLIRLGNDGSVTVFQLNGNAASELSTVQSPSPDANGTGLFGSAMAIDGDWLLVGEYAAEAPLGSTTQFSAGAAHLFDISSLSDPQLFSSILNPLPSASDFFAHSVDLSGSTLLIGAYQEDATDSNAGAAYLFERDELTGMRNAPYTLIENPDVDRDDRFGHRVAIDEAGIWIGSYRDESQGSASSGSGTVSRLTLGAGGVVFDGFLNPGTQGEDDGYGSTVAVNDRWMVIGNPGQDSEVFDTGEVEIYDLSSGTAVLHDTLSPNTSRQAQLGQALALVGDTLVVTSDDDDRNEGTVYVYDLSGAAPVLLDNFESPDVGSEDNFGYSVDFDGQRIVVGDRTTRLDASLGGRAYVYDWDGAEATLLATLINPAPDTQDLFGESVAISGNTVAVGAFRDDGVVDFAGLVHVFNLGADGATHYGTIDSPNPGRGNGFGGSVETDGDRVVVGVSGDDTIAGNSGAVYVFDVTGPAPQLVQSLFRDNGREFGSSLAIRDQRLAVGSRGETLNTVFGGAVHVYQWDEGQYNELASVQNPFGRPGDSFGDSVALSQDRLVVGATAVDDVASNHGAAALFSLQDIEPLTLSLVQSTSAPTDVPEGEFRDYELTRGGPLDEEITVDLDLSDLIDAYIPGPDEVVFAPGQSVASFRVVFRTDTSDEPDEAFTITATHPLSGVSDSVDLLLIDTTDPDVTGFFDNPEIDENGGSTTLRLRRNTTPGAPALAEPLVLELTTSDVGLQFPSSVTIPAGQNEFTVPVSAVDNSLFTGPQSVSLRISSPDEPSVSDFASATILDDERGALGLGLITEDAREGQFVDIRVFRFGDTSEALPVDLSSSDTSELIVPGGAVIPAGESFVDVPGVRLVQDFQFDSVQLATLTATAVQFEPGALDVNVRDSAPPALFLGTEPSSISENGGVATGRLQLFPPPTAVSSGVLDIPITFSLSTSDPFIVVPESLTIPAQETVVTFPITAVDDAVVNGTRDITITATPDLAAYNAKTRSISVTDDDLIELDLAIDNEVIAEGDTTTLTVALSNASISDTVVTLESSDPGEAGLPDSVVIPAGALSATVDISGASDQVVDGNQMTTISATYQGSEVTIDVEVSDVDSSTLSAVLSEESISEGQTTDFVLQWSTPFEYATTVQVSVLDPSAATVSDSEVTLLPLQTSAVVQVSGVLDGVVDADQSTTLNVSSAATTPVTSIDVGVTVANIDQPSNEPSVVLSDDGTLVIRGSDGPDRVKLSHSQQSLRVRTRFSGEDWQTLNFDPAEVLAISVELGDGDDRLDTSREISTDMTVDGGLGNDRLSTGNGNDLIRGGEGDDRIYARAGSDILIGGAGKDRLHGGVDRDLLIGGAEIDRLRGGDDDDLLIGATTNYDDHDSALRSILDLWNQPSTYEDRIASLSAGPQPLVSGSTVISDDERDRLRGDAGQDWYFADDEDRVRASSDEQVS